MAQIPRFKESQRLGTGTPVRAVSADANAGQALQQVASGAENLIVAYSRYKQRSKAASDAAFKGAADAFTKKAALDAYTHAKLNSQQGDGSDLIPLYEQKYQELIGSKADEFDDERAGLFNTIALSNQTAQSRTLVKDLIIQNEKEQIEHHSQQMSLNNDIIYKEPTSKNYMERSVKFENSIINSSLPAHLKDNVIRQGKKEMTENAIRSLTDSGDYDEARQFLKDWGYNLGGGDKDVSGDLARKRILEEIGNDEHRNEQRRYERKRRARLEKKIDREEREDRFSLSIAQDISNATGPNKINGIIEAEKKLDDALDAGEISSNFYKGMKSQLFKPVLKEVSEQTAGIYDGMIYTGKLPDGKTTLTKSYFKKMLDRDLENRKLNPQHYRQLLTRFKNKKASTQINAALRDKVRNFKTLIRKKHGGKGEFSTDFTKLEDARKSYHIIHRFDDLLEEGMHVDKAIRIMMQDKTLELGDLLPADVLRLRQVDAMPADSGLRELNKKYIEKAKQYENLSPTLRSRPDIKRKQKQTLDAIKHKKEEILMQLEQDETIKDLMDFGGGLEGFQEKDVRLFDE